MTAAPSEPAPIPVTIVTGFLGSGKTTLLNRLLRDPAMAGAAVIVNEFGEIGLDHLLVQAMPGDAVLLGSGCLCCAVRGDLVDTMRMLLYQADHGEIPAFDRLLVETSGLADPAPVLQTVMADPALTARYRLAGMATTVDATGGAGRLDGFPEALRQVVLASRLLVTKTDIAELADIARLERRLAALNPAAPRARAVAGDVPVAAVFADADDLLADGYGAADSGWLARAAALPHDHAHDHSAGIATFCLVRDEPLPWPALAAWLDSVTSLRGADLLRVKGLVAVARPGGGAPLPVALHGVQHVFHPPAVLDDWPDGDRRSRIVCIVRGIAEADLDAALDAALDGALDAAVENLQN